MALHNLVDGECGGANALVKAAKHFTQDRGLQQESLIRGRLREDLLQDAKPFSDSHPDELVDEFLAYQNAQHRAAPQTFHMDSLLQEMKDIEKMQQPPVQAPEIRELAAEEKWVEDYLATEPFVQHDAESWSSEVKDGSAADMLSIPGALNDRKWAEEYLECSSHSQLQSENSQEELKTAAANFVTTVNDPKIMETEFVKFVKRITSGEFDGLPGLVDSSEQSEEWAAEFESEIIKTAGEQLVADFQSSEGNDVDYKEGDYWDRLQEEWDQMSKDDVNGEHPWLSSFEAFSDPYKTYEMNKDNPLIDHPDPFQEGLKRLKDGDVPSAVLLFEAAVQKEQENAEGWQFLGTSQAENENDPMAIAALKKCLELNPTNMTALMALSVSYTNESMHVQACHTLHRWLKNNSKYSHLVPENLTFATNPAVASMMDNNLHGEICDIYMAAARLSPLNVDPEVQCGLGVLFNLSEDYAKAVDCFRAAVQAKPDDWQLWNKLGATLANGKRPEEAVQAYYKALELSPGFIRSRYNLGISCVNLKAYKEAVEHFLTALNLQAAGRGLPGSSNRAAMSECIWGSLRLVVSFLERHDLYDAIHERNLDQLNKEFGISS